MQNDLLNRVKLAVLDKNYQCSKYDSAILALYQDCLFYKNKDRLFDIVRAKKEFSEFILNINAADRLKTLLSEQSSCIWGMLPKERTSKLILEAVNKNQEILFGEDTFLRCIIGPAQILPTLQKHYQYACGYILDDLTAYFDATRPSRMEMIINSDFQVSPEQIERSNHVIKKIIENKISKYNNQPIFKPEIGRTGVKKVLVIDQSYNDYSILKGSADDNTFKIMLDTAIKENLDADILIKTHPDSMGKNTLKSICYYQHVTSYDNIYRITEPINPISLIEYADKVYVCTSQFGFEALMAQKEVHTFGMPFYAGWGLTIDNQKCQRRTRKRTLEELFYIAYIYFSLYINPDTNKVCEIEEAIDYLIDKREEYFAEIKIMS